MGLVVILLRVAVFGGVVFGLFFGLAYAARNAKQKRLAQEIGDEMRALKAGLSEGLYTAHEADALTRAIEAKCAEAGIDLAPNVISAAPAPDPTARTSTTIKETP